MWVRSLGWEDHLQKDMATQSRILAWKIPWTEDPGRQQSIESQGVRHNWSDLACPHLFINCNKCTILSNMLIIGKSIRVEVEWVYWTLCTICSKFWLFCVIFCIYIYFVSYTEYKCIFYTLNTVLNEVFCFFLNKGAVWTQAKIQRKEEGTCTMLGTEKFGKKKEWKGTWGWVMLTRSGEMNPGANRNQVK